MSTTITAIVITIPAKNGRRAVAFCIKGSSVTNNAKITTPVTIAILYRVYDCLEELESLGLIKMLQPIGDTKEKTDDQTFRLLNITNKGLEELQSNQLKIE